MYRSIRIALSAGVILLASAAVPPMLPDSTTMSLSGSALAQKTPTTKSTTYTNNSQSNSSREGSKESVITTKPGNRQPAGPAAVTTIKSTKSNTSFKTTQPGKGQQPGPAEATTVKGSKSNGSY